MMEGQTKKETEKQHINAIIFDLDGLLIDSEPVWNDAYIKFITVKGIPDEPAVSSKFRGMGIREIVGIWKKEYGLEGDTDQLAAEYRSYLYELILEPGRLKLMDGARDLLERLKGRYVLGVATSGHRDEMAKKILGLLNVENYFDQVISGDDVTNGKPAPDVYLESARKIDQKPANCLAFEDSVNGVLSGRAAGMRVIGVNADGKLMEQLQEAGADEVYVTLRNVQI